MFWAFHRGAEETGATIHLMEETLDTGPIVGQQAVPVGEGTRFADLERELATLGGALLVEAILTRAAGDLTATPQDPAEATSASFPTSADAVIDPATWSARRAFRFVRGMRSAAVRRPNGDLVPVADADWWESSMTPKTSVAVGQNGILIDVADGRVCFQRGLGDRTG